MINTAIQVVTESIQAVLLALRGLGPTTNDVRAVIDAVSVAGVPPAWLSASMGSDSGANRQNLAQWLTLLQQQEAQLSSWALRGQPVVFWLPGFVNPKVPVAQREGGWCRRCLSC